MKIPMKQLFAQMSEHGVNSHYYNKGNNLPKSKSLLCKNSLEIRKNSVNDISYFGEYSPDKKKKLMSIEDLQRQIRMEMKRDFKL